MPRIRYLKPDFFDDERLCSLKPLSRLLFAGMWCWADREGRLEDTPARLKKNILGYDNCRIEPLLSELTDAGFIIRYEVQGRGYIQVKHFLRHQRPHIKEVSSTYPAPTQTSAEHLPDPPGMGNGEGNRNGIQEQERQTVAGPVPLGYRAVEDLLGSLSKTIIDEIDKWEAPDDWIVEAAKEAALNNGRNVKYVGAIIARWKREGFQAKKKGGSSEPKRYTSPEEYVAGSR